MAKQGRDKAGAPAPAQPMAMFKPGQIPPRAEIPAHVTLDQVYGWAPTAPEQRWSGLTTRLAELCETPLADVQAEDVCFLLRHHTGVEVFLPQALAWLEQDPLTDTQYYAGDLLIVVLNLDLNHLRPVAARLIALAEDALTDPRADGLPDFERQRQEIAAGLERLRNATGAGAAP